MLQSVPIQVCTSRLFLNRRREGLSEVMLAVLADTQKCNLRAPQGCSVSLLVMYLNTIVGFESWSAQLFISLLLIRESTNFAVLLSPQCMEYRPARQLWLHLAKLDRLVARFALLLSLCSLIIGAGLFSCPGFVVRVVMETITIMFGLIRWNKTLWYPFREG